MSSFGGPRRSERGASGRGTAGQVADRTKVSRVVAPAGEYRVAQSAQASSSSRRECRTVSFQPWTVDCEHVCLSKILRRAFHPCDYLPPSYKGYSLELALDDWRRKIENLYTRFSNPFSHTLWYHFYQFFFSPTIIMDDGECHIINRWTGTKKNKLTI